MKEKMLEILTEVSKGIKRPELAQSELLGLFSVSGCCFTNAKTGDYLRCDKVYSQSKKYTVGNMYQIIQIDQIDVTHLWRKVPHMVIRDDKNKLTRISQEEGVSFTEFTLISCR